MRGMCLLGRRQRLRLWEDGTGCQRLRLCGEDRCCASSLQSVHYVKNGDRLISKNTKKSLSDLCRRHRAKSLISIGNLHTRDRVAQRIMRDHMRWQRVSAGLTRVGGRGPLGGGSATIYTLVHRRAILT
jgi:hypothetical protein